MSRLLTAVAGAAAADSPGGDVRGVAIRPRVAI